jgi:hypothetical protein
VKNPIPLSILIDRILKHETQFIRYDAGTDRSIDNCYPCVLVETEPRRFVSYGAGIGERPHRAAESYRPRGERSGKAAGVRGPKN